MKTSQILFYREVRSTMSHVISRLNRKLSEQILIPGDFLYPVVKWMETYITDDFQMNEETKQYILTSIIEHCKEFHDPNTKNREAEEISDKLFINRLYRELKNMNYQEQLEIQLTDVQDYQIYRETKIKALEDRVEALEQLIQALIDRGFQR